MVSVVFERKWLVFNWWKVSCLCKRKEDFSCVNLYQFKKSIAIVYVNLNLTCNVFTMTLKSSVYFSITYCEQHIGFCWDQYLASNRSIQPKTYICESHFMIFRIYEKVVYFLLSTHIRLLCLTQQSFIRRRFKLSAAVSFSAVQFLVPRNQ